MFDPQPNSDTVEQLKNQLEQYNQILSDLAQTVKTIEDQKSLVTEELEKYNVK
jgi:predicted  nucleic acid-binding Zn-ribbon protein